MERWISEQEKINWLSSEESTQIFCLSLISLPEVLIFRTLKMLFTSTSQQNWNFLFTEQGVQLVLVELVSPTVLLPKKNLRICMICQSLLAVITRTNAPKQKLRIHRLCVMAAYRNIWLMSIASMLPNFMILMRPYLSRLKNLWKTQSQST